MLVFNGIAQSLPVDSLIKKLETSKADTSRVILLNRIADFYLYYQPVKSEAYLDEALKLAQQLHYENGEAETYLNFNVLCYRKDDYNKEKEYVDLATAIYKRQNNISAIALCHVYYSWTYYAMGDRERSMDNCLKALDIFQQRRDKRGMGLAYYFMGIINFEFSNNLQQAIKYMEDATLVQEEAGDSRHQALTLSFLGNMYERGKESEKAISCYKKAILRAKASYNRNAESYTLRSMGNYYFTHNKYKEASEHFILSLKMDEEAQNYFGVIRNLNGLAKISYANKEYSKAIEYNERCYKTASEIHDNYGLLFVYEQLAKVYEEKGNIEKALEYNKLYIATKDSVFNVESSSKIAAMQSRSEFDKKLLEQQKENEKKQLLHEEENKRQLIWLLLVIAIAIAAGVIAIIVFRNLRYTQKQKDIIEHQKHIVEGQHKVITQKNKDITDSINYAKRIQQAIMPEDSQLQNLIKDSFVLFLPRDVVSGDFYWCVEKDGVKIIAAADCTGHGVPGAFMSMIGYAFLNEIVLERDIKEPALILSALRFQVIKALKQTGAEGETRDGMDIAIISIDEQKNELQYAGANNPLWLVRNGELIEYKADKRPIGYYLGKGLPFTNHKIPLQKNDSAYIFTDGFADQFGGPREKKFKYLQLKELLVSINKQTASEQGDILRSRFYEWKGKQEQVDDVCIIGLRF